MDRVPPNVRQPRSGKKKKRKEKQEMRAQKHAERLAKTEASNQPEEDSGGCRAAIRTEYGDDILKLENDDAI